MKQKSNVLRTVVAGATGAIVAGAAVAAAVIMSDKKNQKKVKDALGNASDNVKSMSAEVKQKLQRKAE